MIDYLRDTLLDLTDEVYEELKRAIEIHGEQDEVTAEKQFLILTEEFGEIAKAMVEQDSEETKKEIVQTIAMLVKLYVKI